MTSDLDKLTARLQALRAKTIANGCTEQEALAAATKVAELLDRHDLSISDLDIGDGQCERLVIASHKKQRQPISACLPAIAQFCDCKVWREKDETGKTQYVFFGLRPGLEMAHYIFDVISVAMQTAWQSYCKTHRLIRYGQDEKGSFLFGMAISIAEKLTLLKNERNEAVKSASGRDLVVVRQAVVETEFAKLHLSLRSGGASGKKVAAGAFEAGQSAGQSLSITPAIGQGRSRRPKPTP